MSKADVLTSTATLSHTMIPTKPQTHGRSAIFKPARKSHGSDDTLTKAHTQNKESWIANFRKSCRFMADHQIDYPLKVMGGILLGNLLGIPHFWRFIYISYKQPDTELYGKGLYDIMFMFFWVNVFTFLRASVMEYILKPLAKWQGLTKAGKIQRFAEQSWTIIYYSISGGYGFYLFRQSPAYFKTANFWIDYPFIYLTEQFKYYYIIQFSYWLQQIFVLQIEKPRKDYNELVMHHINTLLLIGLSYGCNYTLIGNAVFVYMDIPDIFLALSKSLHYLGYRLPRDISFVTLVITWLYLRCYLYGGIIWSTAVETDLYVDFKLDPSIGWFFPYFAKYIILGLMLGLYALIWFWTRLILKTAWKSLAGPDELKDDRSDSEEDEEPKTNGNSDLKKKN